MTTIAFDRDIIYVGHKAIASVRLVEARDPILLEMVLDTGAAISLLNRYFIAELGLALHDGEPIELIVANGDSAPAWIHSIVVDVFGRRLTLDTAICPSWDTKNLLGMRGFSDQMVVAFDHGNRTIHF